ncbi:unnamed protein product [Urochloa humidicola]
MSASSSQYYVPPALDHFDTSIEGLKSASLGAMGSLLRKLDELARTEDRVRQLRDDLGSINTKLVKLSQVDNPSLTVNYWMKDVRELSYEMEDCVDQLINADDANTKMDWIDNLLGFKNRVAEARERYDRFNLEYGLSNHTTTLNHHFGMVSREPSPVIPVGPVIPVISIKLHLLVERKNNDQNDLKLKVVSILGVEGVGKSMLSQKLWRELGGRFECQAFVRTAKKPDIRMILISILSQIYPHERPEACQVPDLIRDIKKHLKDKRYFIVIDDLWAVSVWDTLSRSFPEGNRCSLIMTTTTIEDVALACCSYDPEYIFRMRPLSAEHSNQLFIKRVFGTGEGCPEQFSDVSDDIVRKCRGLPLAIICMASLVARQKETVEQWRHVQNLLSHNLRSNSSAEVLKQVLKLCYNSLPHCLKTCLLYLSIYPENYLIVKRDLVKQWIAEDFIFATEEKGVVDVASSYFDEMVSLGLIQQIDTVKNKEEVPYVVHPIVFDFIKCQSIEDNFINVIDYSHSSVAVTEKIRRLALHFGSTTYATTPASIGPLQVRSLSFMGLLNSMPALEDFKLVRVIILHVLVDNGETSFPITGIRELLFLRYLQVRCNVTIELPDQIGCLKHLETLEIHARVAAVPSDVLHLPRLQNLCLGRSVTGPILGGVKVSSDDGTQSSDDDDVAGKNELDKKANEFVARFRRQRIESIRKDYEKQRSPYRSSPKDTIQKKKRLQKIEDINERDEFPKKQHASHKEDFSNVHSGVHRKIPAEDTKKQHADTGDERQQQHTLGLFQRYKAFMKVALILALFGLLGAYAAGSISTSFYYAIALAGGILIYVVIPRGNDEVTLRKAHESMEKRHSWLLLLTIFATTMTYQAGLNPPRGSSWLENDEWLHTSDPAKYRYKKTFFYLNSLCFVLSTISLVILLVIPNLYRSSILTNMLYYSVCITAGAFSTIFALAAGKKSTYTFSFVAAVGFGSSVLLASTSRKEDITSDPTDPEIGDGNRKQWTAKKKLLLLFVTMAAITNHQASLEAPGGVWPVHDNLSSWYLAFFYSNSISFAACIVIIVLLLLQSLHDNKWHLRVMNTMTVLVLLGQLVAYAASTCRSCDTFGYGTILIAILLSCFTIYVVLSFFGRRGEILAAAASASQGKAEGNHF